MRETASLGLTGMTKSVWLSSMKIWSGKLMGKLRPCLGMGLPGSMEIRLCRIWMGIWLGLVSILILSSRVWGNSWSFCVGSLCRFGRMKGSPGKSLGCLGVRVGGMGIWFLSFMWWRGLDTRRKGIFLSMRAISRWPGLLRFVRIAAKSLGILFLWDTSWRSARRGNSKGILIWNLYRKCVQTIRARRPLIVHQNTEIDSHWASGWCTTRFGKVRICGGRCWSKKWQRW